MPITRFRALNDTILRHVAAPVTLASLALTFMAPVACAPALAQTPVEHSGIKFPLGNASFADRVVEFRPGPGVAAPHDKPGHGLGPPDYKDENDPNATNTYFSLGNAQKAGEAYVIFEFVDNVLVDVPGDDLFIFEVGPVVELMDVQISEDGKKWIDLGTVRGQGNERGRDIGASPEVKPGQKFRFVKISDRPDGETSPAPFAGPDIDAVGAIGAEARTPPPTTTTAAGGCEKTFGKTWPSSWGSFVVRLDGNRATGTYENRGGQFGPGTFTGTVAGDVLQADWKDARGAGTFTLRLAADGCGFTSTSTVNGPGGPGPAENGPAGRDPDAPKRGGAGAFPADPCTDPAAQQCIEKWLTKAMEILNRRDKQPTAPGGPWRISQYGTLLGHSVINAQPPDGWETRYRRNKYCYVWENWQDTHKLPGYGGELEPLKDFVAACHAESSPPASALPPAPPPGATNQGRDTPVSRMTLLAEHRKVKPGDVVLVPVWLLKGTDLASLNFTVTYDPGVAAAAGDAAGGATPGNLLGDALFSQNTKESGISRLGVAGGRGINGDGTIAYLPFRATGAPGATTPLHIEVTTAADSRQAKLPVATIDGSITILTAGGALKGDCNLDGVVDARDAQCALDMSTRLIPEDLNLDMDASGRVDAVDATLILQSRSSTLLRN